MELQAQNKSNSQEIERVVKRYEFAGAEAVAAQIAQLLNKHNPDQSKNYFVRKDVHGCSLIEAFEIPKVPATTNTTTTEATTEAEPST